MNHRCLLRFIVVNLIINFCVIDSDLRLFDTRLFPFPVSFLTILCSPYLFLTRNLVLMFIFTVSLTVTLSLSLSPSVCMTKSVCLHLRSFFVLLWFSLYKTPLTPTKLEPQYLIFVSSVVPRLPSLFRTSLWRLPIRFHTLMTIFFFSVDFL